MLETKRKKLMRPLVAEKPNDPAVLEFREHWKTKHGQSLEVGADIGEVDFDEPEARLVDHFGLSPHRAAVLRELYDGVQDKYTKQTFPGTDTQQLTEKLKSGLEPNVLWSSLLLKVGNALGFKLKSFKPMQHVGTYTHKTTIQTDKDLSPERHADIPLEDVPVYEAEGTNRKIIFGEQRCVALEGEDPFIIDLNHPRGFGIAHDGEIESLQTHASELWRYEADNLSKDSDFKSNTELQKKALNLVDESISLDPLNSEALNSKGLILWGLGRHGKAIDYFNKSLEAEPDNLLFASNKAGVLSELGRHEEAINIIKKCVETDSKDVASWYNLGIMLSKAGEKDEALNAFDRSLELAPDFQDSTDAKIRIFTELKQFKEAFALMDQVLAKNPTYEGMWLFKANLHSDLGQLREAIHAYDRALQLDPHDYAHWHNKGNLHGKLKEFSKALDAYEHALRANPDSIQTWITKGMTHHNLGDFKATFNSFKEAVRRDPDHAEAKDILGKYRSFLKHNTTSE